MSEIGITAYVAYIPRLRMDRAAIAAVDARRARPGSVQELHYGAGAVALRVGGGADCALPG